jgi:carbamoyl-phosphate synthase small subunit
MVRDAKARGVRVTAEATPHHLLLSDEAVRGYDPNTKMAPPLRGKRDVEALVEALADGTVDCIATDHAPHATSEKEDEFEEAANGVVGLETAVPLLLDRLVRPGVVDLATLVTRLSVAPAALAESARRKPGHRDAGRHHRARPRRGVDREARGVPLEEPQYALRGRHGARRAVDDHRRRRAGEAMTPALLALADGRVFRGDACGAGGEASGEVVFNTAMTGYQEILTDPSYRGQMVCMTYPLIGNYGISPEDVESRRPWVNGFIVKEMCGYPSNWRGRMRLEDYLREHGIVAIQGIDTRALTRHLRDHGAQEGIISTVEADADRLVERARALPGLVGRDLVTEVSVAEPHGWDQGTWDLARGYTVAPEPRFRVVAFDSGIKQNILRQLASLECNVTVVPARTPAEAVLEMRPHGVFLSNGPGDPEAVPYLVESVRGLVGRTPIFGICLGNQILGLALGGRTYKLKFGHHGANHPVRDLATGRVEITAQNHGFSVDPASVAKLGLDETHVNLNDGTSEGMRHRELPIFSVQYHPEASPGPHDAHYLFHRFIDLMSGGKGE